MGQYYAVTLLDKHHELIEVTTFPKIAVNKEVELFWNTAWNEVWDVVLSYALAPKNAKHIREVGMVELPMFLLVGDYHESETAYKGYDIYIPSHSLVDDKTYITGQFSETVAIVTDTENVGFFHFALTCSNGAGGGDVLNPDEHEPRYINFIVSHERPAIEKFFTGKVYKIRMCKNTGEMAMATAALKIRNAVTPEDFEQVFEEFGFDYTELPKDDLVYYDEPENVNNKLNFIGAHEYPYVFSWAFRNSTRERREYIYKNKELELHPITAILYNSLGIANAVPEEILVQVDKEVVEMLPGRHILSFAFEKFMESESPELAELKVLLMVGKPGTISTILEDITWKDISREEYEGDYDE